MAARRWGVIVCDVVGSSRTQDVRSVLSAKLRIATIAHLGEKRIRLPYAVTAGDEFQTVANDLHEIPGLLFDLRRRMRPLQLRVGIGIGLISGHLRPPVNQLSGQAFEFARIAIEEAKEGRGHSGKNTRFHSQNEQLDLVANLIYSLHDALAGNLSEKQWETVDAYLAKGRVDLAARALKINASTASRNLRRSHFWQSLETIDVMKKIIESSFPKLHESVSKERIA
jgi:SatD family protein